MGGVLMIDEPYNKRPLKELRRNNLAVNYNVMKVPEFKFMEALNRRWTEQWKAKRNVSWGLKPDGSEYQSKKNNNNKGESASDPKCERLIEEDAKTVRDLLGM